MESNLIRHEVLDSQRSTVIGDVVLIHPVAHVVLVAVCTAILFALLAMLFFGEYTRHSMIAGVIEPAAGLSKIYAPQTGVVVQVLVHEGSVVQRGQVLVLADAERRNGSGDDVHREIDDRARARLSTLREELGDTMRLSDQDMVNSRESLETQQKTRVNLEAQIRAQTVRLQTSKTLMSKYESLLSSGFISELQLSQQQSDLLDQQMRLDSLKKDLIAAEGEITRLERERQELPLKRNVARTQIERNIASVQGEISQIAGDHGWSVVAPADGTVTSVTVVPGQTMQVGTALVSLVPAHSTLRAKVYAQSKDLGFVHVGAPVKLRFDAFPFQKFGLSRGRVSAIADAPTPINELTSNTSLTPKGLQNQEALFAIVVDLDQEYVMAYGRREPLRTGMQLDADIQLDRRRLYEWMLEPLLTVTGH